jgi:hypothetical protein
MERETDLAEQLKRLMNSYVPLANGKSWQGHAVADNVIISRYPMRQQSGELVAPYPLPQFGLPDFKYGYASALIDVSEKSGGAMTICLSHLAPWTAFYSLIACCRSVSVSY